MKLSTNRTKATAIAVFLMLTIAAACVALPTANAHTPPWTIPTWCFLAVNNNPIGVNQQVTIVFWINEVPPTATGAYGDRWTFTVEVTKPDNSKETLGPFTSDPVGGGWTGYTPTQVGTYTIVAKFPGKTITGIPVPPGGYFGVAGTYINDTYQASTSDPITLTVQQEPIQPWPEAPLPTEFWTRPINNMNRNWAPLAGNWLAGAAQQWPLGATGGTTTPFGLGTGPESAHIMWAKPYWEGGIMDARFGDYGYYTGLSYEPYGLTPPIIMNGKLYYNVLTPPRYGWYCLDLYTGETLFFHNTTGSASFFNPPWGFEYSGRLPYEALSFGQIYNYESPNQHGGFPYLWSIPTVPVAAPMMMFDAFTGNYICSIANVSTAGTNVYGKDGSILYYNIVNLGTPSAPNRYLQVWNTSRAIWHYVLGTTGYVPQTLNSFWMWRPMLNFTFDGRYGFSLNASIPDVQGSILAVREDQYVIGGTAGKRNDTYTLQGNLWALSLKPGQEGTLLWNITYTPPQTVVPDIVYACLGFGRMAGPIVDPEDGVFLFAESMTRKRWCFSLETGQLLWTSAPEPQMNYYGLSTSIYQGKLFSYGYSGVLIAYDIKTGKVLWNYTASQVGFESPYGNYPLVLGCIADGKLYFYSSEHSPTMPLWRGSYIRCINASNGVELWKMNNWANGLAIADGYLVGLNLYDNQIYCYGKGPSATTVTASPKVSVHESSVLIEGTVTDQSPGAKGTPAIADESMQAWMEYLYEQQGIPGNATGVEVTLDTLDPNGNFIHIDTVKSDMSGMFKKAFTPEVPGEYTIIATFMGSKSYYSSYAETAIYVSEAPPATPPPPPEAPMPPYELYIIGTGIAIIIAVAIVGILILRKRP